MEVVLELCVTAVAAALYGAALLRVRRRGRPVPPPRAWAFALGLAVLVVTFVVPLEQRFATHMLQHLLIGDLAPILLVLGLDGPLLRPLLALRPVQRLRALANPLVALPLWSANLAAWHVPGPYDAALADPGLHALQHGMFFWCGMLLWSVLLEPIPGPRWFTPGRKLVYVGAMTVVMLAVSQTLIWVAHPLYSEYGLADQRAGGGVMLVEGALVMIGAAVWLLLPLLAEAPLVSRPVSLGTPTVPAAPAEATRGEST